MDIQSDFSRQLKAKLWHECHEAIDRNDELMHMTILRHLLHRLDLDLECDLMRALKELAVDHARD